VQVPAALVLALLSLAPRVAQAAPSYAATSLVDDVERIVDAQESASWFVDADALVEMRTPLLESVCRAPPSSRQEALALLEAEHRETGDARRLYEAEGRKVTSLVERARFAERKELALRTAMSWAERECPFWVQPSPAFRGMQSDRDRFTLSFESGGNAQVRRTQGAFTIGAGGVGRLLAGRGFGGDLSVYAGLEFGGGAMLKPRVQPTEFVVNYFPAVPVVIRLHDTAWHYDLELAAVSLFQADNGAVSYGGRFGMGVGLATLRTRGVIGWAGAVAMVEHYFERSGRPAAQFLRGGVRVGVIWDGE
jgi:hypothetical protein